MIDLGREYGDSNKFVSVSVFAFCQVLVSVGSCCALEQVEVDKSTFEVSL